MIEITLRGDALSFRNELPEPYQIIQLKGTPIVKDADGRAYRIGFYVGGGTVDFWCRERAESMLVTINWGAVPP